MRLSGKTLLLPCALLFAYFALAGPSYASEKEVWVAGDVTVPEGQTVEEVSTAWGNVSVQGEVKGDVRSGNGDIRIEGPVGGNVKADFGDVNVDNRVGGDVHVGHGDVHLENGARVGGNIHYGSGTLTRDPNASVGGNVMAGMASGFGDDDSPLGALSGVIGWTVMASLIVAAAVLLAVAAPRPLRASARNLEVYPGRSLLLGLGSVLGSLVLSFLLAMTIVGIPLALLLLPACGALVLFGVLVTAYFLGRKIVLVTGRYRAGDALAAAIGALIVSLAYLIPILGFFIFAVLALLGAGAAVSALFGRWRVGPPRATHASYEDYLAEREA